MVLGGFGAAKAKLTGNSDDCTWEELEIRMCTYGNKGGSTQLLCTLC